MTGLRQYVGDTGEKAAREYLEKNGYRIIETNFRCRLGEIDLVALDGNTTVIVEVRTKTGDTHGLPEESISGKKARRLYRLALYYLQSKYGHEVPSRIDLVAVTVDKTDHSIQKLNHIRGILSG